MANKTKSALKKRINGEPHPFIPFSNRPCPSSYYLRKAKARCFLAPGNCRAIFRNEPACRSISIFVTNRPAIGGTKLQIQSGIPNRTAVHFRHESPRAKHSLWAVALFLTGPRVIRHRWTFAGKWMDMLTTAVLSKGRQY
jgi:hypothetical protein